MSNIDDQIKFLQRQKKKIQFLKFIKNKAESHSDVDKDIRKEVSEMVGSFIDIKIKEIESGQEVGILSSNTFSDQDVQILRQLIDKVSKKSSTPISKPTPVKPVETPPKQKLSKPLKKKVDQETVLQFRDSYLYLSDKHVTVENPNSGEQFEGKVVGLQYPHVILRTDSGDLKIPPEDIIGL